MHTTRRHEKGGDREGRELGEISHEKGYKGERELVEGIEQKREIEGRVRKETQLTKGTERERELEGKETQYNGELLNFQSLHMKIPKNVDM
jgi:hypothetical protein